MKSDRLAGAKHWTLAGGARVPTVGLGTWKIPLDQTAEVVEQAVEIGYRHIDCACDYGNEPQVGSGLNAVFGAARCHRQDLWVTSKLWNTYHRAEHVRAACERSLKDLQLDYLDLYLVHFPIALEYIPFDKRYPPEWLFDPAAAKASMKPIAIPYAETWGAMERLVEQGLVRHIGVCNLTVSLLRDLLSYCTIRPVVHQVELHPYLAQPRLLRFCNEQQILLTAFSPLGAESYLTLNMAGSEERILADSVVMDIAREIDLTPAQVVLRWALQRGTIPIPKSSSRDHLNKNLHIYDCELSPSQMGRLNGLDRARRFNDPGEFCESAFGTFYPIFD